MPTIGEKITDIALDQLRMHPDGVRYADLVRLVQAVDGSLKTNTVHGTVWDIATRLPEKVYKPSRGLFRLSSSVTRIPINSRQNSSPSRRRRRRKKTSMYHLPTGL